MKSLAPWALLGVSLLAACADSTTTPLAEPTGTVAAAKGASGGGGGGGGTTTPSFQVLPTTAPAAGVLLRESFGPGDSMLRPASGKGDLRPDFVHTSIGGFWVEWPGNKNQWVSPAGDQTWKFCANSPNEFEVLPTPLQNTQLGCVASEWFDPVPYSPTARVPFVAPNAPYELTIDGYPAGVWPYYIAVGFTTAVDTISGLVNRGNLWLGLHSNPADQFTLSYEVRVNGMSGPLLASGDIPNRGWNTMSLRYDPVNHEVSARVNDTVIGPVSATVNTPKFVAIEGVGILDNLVVWQR